MGNKINVRAMLEGNEIGTGKLQEIYQRYCKTHKSDRINKKRSRQFLEDVFKFLKLDRRDENDHDIIDNSLDTLFTDKKEIDFADFKELFIVSLGQQQDQKSKRSPLSQSMMIQVIRKKSLANDAETNLKKSGEVIMRNSNEDNSGYSLFDKMPLNCCIHILHFLDLGDIYRFCLTSKKHAQMLSNEKLFYLLCARDLEQMTQFKDKDATWRHFYKENLRFEFDPENTTEGATIINSNGMNTVGNTIWLLSSSKRTFGKGIHQFDVDIEKTQRSGAFHIGFSDGKIRLDLNQWFSSQPNGWAMYDGNLYLNDDKREPSTENSEPYWKNGDKIRMILDLTSSSMPERKATYFVNGVERKPTPWKNLPPEVFFTTSSYGSKFTVTYKRIK